MRVWARRVDQEQKATRNHLLSRHPRDLPRTKLGDSQQTAAELMNGFYRMPVSIRGSNKKNFMMRGARAFEDDSSVGSTVSSSVAYKSTASSQSKSRSKSVGSAPSLCSVVTQSVHSRMSKARSKKEDMFLKCGSSISRKSRSVDDVHRSVSECGSTICGRSEVREMVNAQVYELLKPLKAELELSIKARMAADSK